MMPDREKVIKGLQEIVNDKWMKNHADWYVSVCEDALALLKKQDEIIKELQNAYGYLQDQFFEAQDKLLNEQENASKRNPVIVCPHCGKRVK